MKTTALRIGLIGSGDESSEKLLRLLTEQGMQIVHALKPGELSERLITATNLDVWLLDLDDSQWHDQLDVLMDRSSVPIFFNEHQAIEGQQHLDYWARNLINRMFELVGETPMAAPAIVQPAMVSPATVPERKTERLPEQRPSDALTAMPAGLDPELLEEIAELEQLLQTSNQLPLEEIDDLAVTLREPTPAASVQKPAEAEKPAAKATTAAPAPATTSVKTATPKPADSAPTSPAQPQPVPATPATAVNAAAAAGTAPAGKPQQRDNPVQKVSAPPTATSAPVADAMPVTKATPVNSAAPVTAATPVTAAAPVTTAPPVIPAPPATPASPVTAAASEKPAAAETPMAGAKPAAATPIATQAAATSATVDGSMQAPAAPTVSMVNDDVAKAGASAATTEAVLPEKYDWPSFPAPKPVAVVDADNADPDFAPMRPQPAAGPMRELARPSVAPLVTAPQARTADDDVAVPTLTEAPAGEFELELEFEALSDDDVPVLEDAVSDDAVTELEVPMLESVAEATEFEIVPDTSLGLPCDLWVLGASLGGPAALKRFFTAIDQPLPISFLLVQHIDAHFLPVLGKILEQANAFYNVQILARPGLIEPGALLLAPIERRLRFLDAGQIVLSGKTWSPPYAPCIDDVLLDVAAAYPGQVNSIIFSGMGADGVNGARAVQAAGGEIWLQEAGSCASSVMPDAIQNAGLSRYRATPEQLATRLMARYRPAVSSKNLA